MIDLGGLTALVTGGSRGIGRAAAQLLARSGADVAITYRTRAREADATAAEVRALAPTLVVNWVAPGWVDTEMSAPAFTPENRERIRESIPIGRIASAEDVAGPIPFLCSSLARHITGEVLNVNGGSVLCG